MSPAPDAPEVPDAEVPAPEVLVERRGRAGVLTLNRPRAINALTHNMVRLIEAALIEWASDPAVETVVLTGAGERGLCAGGDIVTIHADGQRMRAGKSGAGKTGAGTLEFWREEYILNARIGSYPKPFVAVMDGIVLGGGVGISAHANTRVVTQTSSIGMPEVGIGFVPDVGGTYLLSRAGAAGMHAALTTQRFGPGQAIASGFADHFVPQEKLPALLEALESEPANKAVARFAEPAPDTAPDEWVEEAFSADTVEQILARLDGMGDQHADKAAASKAAAQIRGKSPVALKATLRSIREAGELASLEEVLNLEYRVSTAALSSHDLVEGIRAQIIDKDRNPQWQPATLAEVTSADVEAYFAPLGDNELGLTPASERA